MPTPIIIKGNRYTTANIDINVIITNKVPKNTFKKNSKISYNIFICKFIKIIFKKLRVYLSNFTFGSKNAYLL